MRIVLLCATRRGYRFLRKLAELVPPSTDLLVFSFKEEPWEPRFLDNIRDFTVSSGWQFYEAKNLGHERWSHFWESTEFDLMLAVSWRYMIPSQVYQRALLGTFVFHDSLLPGYRGFAPTVWAMINGEDHTGVTLFEIAERMDEGDIVDQTRLSIGPDETISAVTERVTEVYLDLLERNINDLMKGTVKPIPQDHSLATYTCKRLPEDNLIDWRKPSNDIHNLIRAVSSPYPGAYTYLGDRRLRIWSARRMVDYHVYVGGIPGRVVEIKHGEGVIVLTGDGAIMLCDVQIDGGEIVCASETINSLSQSLSMHSSSSRNEKN